MASRIPKVLIPSWAWLFFFGRRRVTMDGVYLTTEIRNFLGEYTTHIKVGSPEWREWIDRNDRFTFSNTQTWCLFQKERRGNRYYWYAYKWHKHGKRAERVYIGKIETLSSKEIVQKALRLEEMAQFTRNEIARRRKLIKSLRRQRQRRMANARAKLRRRAEIGQVEDAEDDE